MQWTCSICRAEHEGVPLCIGFEPPWRALVSEKEFGKRVELTEDQCMVDKKTFFVRGHIEISIHDYPESLALSVWSSLSEESFINMSERRESPDRASDPPYFGWLCTSMPACPSTLHLKFSVQSRPPGLTRLFTIELSDHPLAIDQHNGISVERWHQLAHQLLHA